LTILEICQLACHIGNMTKTPKRPRDVSQLAKMMVDIASGEGLTQTKPIEKGNRKHIGGSKGGVVRAEKLNEQQRSEIARIAAQARWKKS
jgi:hypothetical protein